eukprot:c24270_g1_i2 orf=253-621(-)
MAKNSAFVPLSSMGELKVDWLETEESHILKVDVPGLKKEDLSIQTLGENVLQLTGVHTGNADSKGCAHILERPQGTFLRQYKLPDNALLNMVQAFDDDGILTITIPKLKPYVRTIPIFVSKI